MIVGSVITYFYLDSKITRKNILVDYKGRPVQGAGTNWLITGSDSRQGLTRKEERKLATGLFVVAVTLAGAARACSLTVWDRPVASSAVSDRTLSW